MTTAETNAAKTPATESPAQTPATESPAQTPTADTPEILNLARTKVLENGEPLNYEETLQVLQLGDEHLDELLDLAHQVRLKWCGDAVEMEGIISLQTGGCPEDCHFCAQSGLFESPVRSIQLDITPAGRGCEADRQDRRHGVLHRRRGEGS